jgi:abequosyltransferase
MEKSLPNSSQTPRLSICIPVYNFGAFIGETLDSILPQMVPGVEVLVVDGASTDDTQQVVTDRMARCPQLRYVRLEKRGGIDADMATSVDLARGEYCWLFSGDDVMRPYALGRALSKLPSGYDVLICQNTNCDKQMRRLIEPPPFRDNQVLSLNLADSEERHRYFGLAENTEALFSFMSALIVRRAAWQSAPEPKQFMGSCWGHVARLLSLTRRELKVHYVGEVWLDKRGENDSFMDRGVVNRLRLAIDGYTGIATHYFGPDSWETSQVVRLLQNELRIAVFFWALRATQLDPERESKAELDRLMSVLYGGAGLRNAGIRAVYHLCPWTLFDLTKRIYKSVKKPFRKTITIGNS